MAYRDKEKQKEKRREWYKNNPDRVKAMRERANEKRRQLRLSDPEYLKRERVQKRMARLKMTEEELAAYDEQKRQYKNKYNREWAKRNGANTYARIKERMASDPEYAERMRAQWKRNNAKRNRNQKVENETPEQRERRLQSQREYRARKAREKKLMEQLTPVIKTVVKKEVKPKETQPKPKPNLNIKKPGRFAMMARWNNY